jgi:hypothetical protein
MAIDVTAVPDRGNHCPVVVMMARVIIIVLDHVQALVEEQAAPPNVRQQRN